MTSPHEAAPGEDKNLVAPSPSLLAPADRSVTATMPSICPAGKWSLRTAVAIGSATGSFRGASSWGSGRGVIRATVEERFWAKVNKDGPVPDGRPDLGPCWLWTASTVGHGYGQFCPSAARSVRAHRFAYQLLIGPIPGGLELDHLCRVKTCVNPAHLEPVTHAENVMRGESPTAINARKTHCKHGHELTPDNCRPLPRFPNARGECRTCRRRWRREAAAKAKANRGLT